ncbi:methyl-accepting chemotaxis protein [Sphingomonas kyeonggiensis]|uniref:Methyl-accepting chemotaxis protein n=1 Tax=Sphingomonas kyeonggiensis TaxID=1268553 RepID=A0A7W7NSW2_9SPHN|nr:globin-coupled sensor protein [Sphingomonas kyeonggiensis]MBB4839327.1 methyl-accepting chemotaxis protein [Sphingomonas kyeonggiensis]
MTDHLSSRLAYMEMGPAQRATLSANSTLIRSVIGKALDRFYTRVRATPETARFFSNADHMRGAQSAQEKHWGRIMDGNFDEQYYQSVRRIGATHSRIGLEPRWYVGGYALVLEHLIEATMARTPLWRRLVGAFRPRAAAALPAALSKAALLDMELSISIYLEEEQVAREKAVQALDEALAALADGDLTRQLANMPATYASLERSYNHTLAKMQDMIRAVTAGSQRINGTIHEIAQASDDLARRTQANAASLEETNAAVSQMDSRSSNTARAAQSTVARADQAIATVDDGRSVAHQAVEAMNRVSESAKGIDTVIEGLDKIAFQTRVLAMNAAVEAGRAGEAGRGFAVVADLVSALAMRAEEEAGRARDQLTTTQAEVVTAVDAVMKVDGALANISSDVGEVHALLGTMAQDNKAQAVAIGEVSTAIGAMDRGTQQNAAMVEETSAATRTLEQEAETLAELTSAFRTDAAAAPARANGRHPIVSGVVRNLPAAAVSALRAPN